LRGWGVGSVDERHFCDYCDNSGWQCCDERGGGDEEDEEEQTPPPRGATRVGRRLRIAKRRKS
jgi:hypothetical protein